MARRILTKRTFLEKSFLKELPSKLFNLTREKNEKSLAYGEILLCNEDTSLFLRLGDVKNDSNSGRNFMFHSGRI